MRWHTGTSIQRTVSLYSMCAARGTRVHCVHKGHQLHKLVLDSVMGCKSVSDRNGATLGDTQ